MEQFNLDLSYSIISAIRVGINPNIPEDEKISYDIDTAEDVFNQTKGYQLQETIKFIETSTVFYNQPIFNSSKN